MTMKRVSLILFIILFIVMSILMLIPNPPNIAQGIKSIDKFAHFAAFFMLSVLLALASGRDRGRKIRTLILSAVVLALYGIIIEQIQRYTGRNPELADFVADFAGIVAGCFTALFFL